MTEREVKCPRCGKPSLFTPANASRPFCSERCKLIDLGDWADGKFAIPVEPARTQGSEFDEDEEGAAQMQPHSNDDESDGSLH